MPFLSSLPLGAFFRTEADSTIGPSGQRTVVPAKISKPDDAPSSTAKSVAAIDWAVGFPLLLNDKGQTLFVRRDELPRTLADLQITVPRYHIATYAVDIVNNRGEKIATLLPECVVTDNNFADLMRKTSDMCLHYGPGSMVLAAKAILLQQMQVAEDIKGLAFGLPVISRLVDALRGSYCTHRIYHQLQPSNSNCSARVSPLLTERQSPIAGSGSGITAPAGNEESWFSRYRYSIPQFKLPFPQIDFLDRKENVLKPTIRIQPESFGFPQEDGSIALAASAGNKLVSLVRQLQLDVYHQDQVCPDLMYESLVVTKSSPKEVLEGIADLNVGLSNAMTSALLDLQDFPWL